MRNHSRKEPLMDLSLFQDLTEAVQTLKKIGQELSTLPTLPLKSLDPEKTVLLHIDIVEGFLHKGALSSPRVADMLPYVVDLNERLADFSKIFILDEHGEEAEEFGAYPPHCVVGTGESELVEALKPFAKKEHTFTKNSTNLFHAPGFLDLIEDHPEWDTYLIVGDVSDICVLQGALTLKTYFNQAQQNKRLILLTKGVETFDLAATLHDATLMNLFTLYNLQMNGIELYEDLS